MGKKKSKAAESTADKVFQFKITLAGIEPPIWRQFQAADCSLAELHDHIQEVMGWDNAHLYHFEIGDNRYADSGLLDEAFDPYEDEDSTLVNLRDLLEKRRKGFHFSYVYDFGDNWWHDVVYEGMHPVEAKKSYPTCLAGARACPPEDCGGPPGYFNLLEVLANARHPDRSHILDWTGNYDPEKFTVDAVNKRLRRAAKG